MFDEVGLYCPKCGKAIVFQSKAGPCELRSYILETAPLLVLADLNSDGAKGRLYCEHCHVQIEIPIRFIVSVRAKGEGFEDEMREA